MDMLKVSVCQKLADNNNLYHFNAIGQDIDTDVLAVTAS